MNTNETLIDVAHLSSEERHQYYKDWKQSGLKALEFCKEKRLPFISFRYWCKRFKTQKPVPSENFLPVTLTPQKKIAAPSTQQIHVEMKLPNNFQLQLLLSRAELLSFVRGLY